MILTGKEQGSSIRAAFCSLVWGTEASLVDFCHNRCLPRLSCRSPAQKDHLPCNLLGPLQESFGLFGPEIHKKSKKGSWRLSDPWSKKVQRAKIKKIRDFERDWKFRARMKFSSEPPTTALFLWGKSRRRDWTFRARLKISIEIEKFERDWIFWSLGPLGVEKSQKKVKNDSKTTFFQLFQPFSICFNVFWSRRREAPGTFFRLFGGFRARRARMTPVRGQGDRNIRHENVNQLIRKTSKRGW